MHDTPAARDSARLTALLGAPIVLRDPATGAPLGPRLQQLTPWHDAWLLAYANAFATGARRPDLLDALQYCWICSPAFVRATLTPDSPPRFMALRFALYRLRWRYALGLPRLVIRAGRRGPLRYAVEWALDPRAIRALHAHASGRLLDRPSLPRKAGEAAPSAVADGPHVLADREVLCRRLLGYTRAEYWHTPYAHTNQLLTLALGGVVPRELPRFDRERDRAAGDRLRERHRAWAARQPAQPPGRN